MPITSERRQADDRRTLPELHPIQQRTGERRGDERRDAPRIRRPFSVRARPDAQWVACEGDLSLDGAYLCTTEDPVADTVEVRFRLPDLLDPVTVTGRVVRTELVQMIHGKTDREMLGVQVLFDDIPVAAQLSLARFLEFELRLQQSRIGFL